MVISISNHKGGTGKTTTTMNLASSLIKKGKSVLLVDIDPQANLTYCLGLSNIVYDCADWILKRATPRETLLTKDQYHIIPSSIDLYNKEYEVNKMSELYSFKLLDSELEKLKSTYDYILIDCPPSFSIYTKNAFVASDYLIIPTTFDVLSIQGIQQIDSYVNEIQLTLNPKLEILGVVGVNVNERRSLTSEVLQYIRDNFKLNIFNNYIRSNVKAAEAPSFCKSVVEYAPESNSSKDYLAFTSEFLKIVE